MLVVGFDQTPRNSKPLILGIPDRATPFVQEEVGSIADCLPNAKLLLGPGASVERLRELGRRSQFIRLFILRRTVIFGGIVRCFPRYGSVRWLLPQSLRSLSVGTPRRAYRSKRLFHRAKCRRCRSRVARVGKRNHSYRSGDLLAGPLGCSGREHCAVYDAVLPSVGLRRNKDGCLATGHAAGEDTPSTPIRLGAFRSGG